VDETAMSEAFGLYRIIDANANRAREGLRAVEEYLRLARNDASLTAQLKKLRHQITDVIAEMNMDDRLIQARGSDSDVGATAPAGAEAARTDIEHVVIANLRRSQEALRVLEEYGKLLSTEAASAFKKLRFESYTLEKAIRLYEHKQSQDSPVNP
jgi:thiamine-phosphate pyrophosphorylase